MKTTVAAFRRVQAPVTAGFSDQGNEVDMNTIAFSSRMDPTCWTSVIIRIAHGQKQTSCNQSWQAEEERGLGRTIGQEASAAYH